MRIILCSAVTQILSLSLFLANSHYIEIFITEGNVLISHPTELTRSQEYFAISACVTGGTFRKRSKITRH